MKKALFCHDHIFLEYEKDFYSPGKMTYDDISRYFIFCHSVTIVSRSKEVDEIDRERYKSVTGPQATFIKFPNASSFNSLIFNRKLVELAKNIINGYDIVIVRLPSEIGNIFAKAAKELGVCILVEVVACVWDNLWNFGKLSAKIYAPLAFLRMKKNVKSGNFVHYVTSKFLQSRYPACQNALTLSVSDVFIRERKNNTYKPSNDTCVNLCLIGSLDNKIKGIDIAIKAISKLEEEVKLYIIGPGDPNQFQSLLNELDIIEKIIFIGTLKDSEAVMNFLNECIDIYIQPSYQEGMPRAVIEAMSCGIPCIVSNAGGMPEIIQSDWIHSRGNSSELANKIMNLIKSPVLIGKTSSYNFNKSREFLPEVLNKKRNDFYLNIKIGMVLL
ncbi:glycosyltransferase [Budvicia aquatica]|uniref:Lipopolysaccharide core biosynthesis protein rfaG n=1 Tax=Budvicia aquatica TaxID=82979 RepID=A0A2C6CYR7_9GAMM|nr:glycosyltransferase [Budvicia aquatica]PHI31819.1 hypothetical protein CRN84_22120 [Budvicia aquatica]VFS52819.1 Lipopolysaccharide core biosynthesis protein rfaG [Budvicia aquatica]